MIRPSVLMALNALPETESNIAASPTFSLGDEDKFEDKSQILSAVLSDPELVERRFKDACFRDFQKPEKLNIKFGKTPVHKLLGGYFSSLSLQAKGGGVDYVKLKGFNLLCSGIHFDLQALLKDGRLDVRHVEDMDMSVSVKEEAFNSLFQTHSKKMAVQNPEIRMFDNEISFSGTVKAFLFKSRVSARGPLEITKDGKVNFNLKQLKISGLNLPGFAVRKISSTINPIADFNKFKFWECWNMNLKSVVVKPGVLTLSSFDSNDMFQSQLAETALEPNNLSEPQKG